MSSRRSRSGGSSISTVLSRNSRSWRKRLSSRSAGRRQVGRGDHADVDRHRLVGADRVTTWRCSSTVSNLGWRCSGRLPISSRNRVPPSAAWIAPDPVGAGVGEGALHMAEQLGIRSDRRRPRRDRPSPSPCRRAATGGGARARPVPCRCRSRPGSGRWRRSARRASISEWTRAIAGELPSSGVPSPGRTRRSRPWALGRHRRARAAQRGGGAHGREQPLVRPGLGHEIGRAALHRLDRDLHPGMRGDHHHDRVADRAREHRAQQRRSPRAASVAPRAKLASSRIDVGRALGDRGDAPRRSVDKATTSVNRPRSSSRAASRMSSSSSTTTQRPKRFAWSAITLPPPGSDNGQSPTGQRSRADSPVRKRTRMAVRPRRVAEELRISGISGGWHGSC